jgi:hypothetical protein
MFKNMLIGAMLVASSFSALAEQKTIQIIDISEELIFSSTGEIFEIHDNETLDLARSAQRTGAEIAVQINENSDAHDFLGKRDVILSIELVSRPVANKDRRNNEPVKPAKLLNDYITDFNSQSDLESFFYNLTTRTKSRSQCYNRAHVWSWELYRQFYKGQRIQTGKVWVYFTKKYIKEYGHKWWFHIAPYLTVRGDIKVIDRSFSNKPESIQDWTNRFIVTNEKCDEVKLYSQYEARKYSVNCVVMRSSVHYWQPYQLKNAELKGQAQTDWNSYEVKKAYSNAIGWFSKPPKL